MTVSHWRCHALRHASPFRTLVRFASTLIGDSGRVYHRGELLMRHHKDSVFDIYEATADTETFVLKPVSKELFNLSSRLAVEFAGSRYLRHCIDSNRDENVLVYRYFKTTLLSLLQQYPDFPSEDRWKIIRDVGSAIQEPHAKDWIHIDIEPDNILVDWHINDEGKPMVTDVVLGDFDIAFHLDKNAELRTPSALGNVMWRSPEGQTGMGITKASDIYSYGLVCIYAVGGGSLLLLTDRKELERAGLSPEQDIVIRHFCFFGPVPEQFFRHIAKHMGSENWLAALRDAAQSADEAAEADPEQRFASWGASLGTEPHTAIAGMTKLDPAERWTIDQVLASPAWQE